MKRYSLNIFVKLYLFWLIFIFFFTELISYLHLISREIVISGNLIFFIGFIYISRENFKKIDFSFLREKSNLIICIVLALIFIQGFFSAPNTTDAMTYHITRVMYWIQDQTVSQNYIRSSHDFNPPFAEFVLLHLYLILGSDRVLFLSQWLAFAFSIYLSGVIAIQLGASKETKGKIMLFVATIPIAVLQSSGTQVDILTSVLTLFAIFFSLQLVDKPSFSKSLLFGLILGLGMQIKAPFMFYSVIPLSILFLYKIREVKRYFFLFLLIAIITISMQLRYYSQNITLYGNVLGQHFSGSQNTYVNERFDLPAITSNVVRNLMNQIPVPIFTSSSEQVLAFLYDRMGTNINDSKTTYPGLKFSVLPVIYPQEDIAGGPVSILFIFLGLFYLFQSKFENINLLKICFLALFIYLFIFSFVLKWEPYHPRLQIGFLIFGTILGVLIVNSNKVGKQITSVFIYFSVFLAVVLILFNVGRPYISYKPFYNYVKSFSMSYPIIPESFFIRPRVEQYFNSRPYLYVPYDQVTSLIASEQGHKNIVMKLSDDEFEYPLWALLKEKNVDFYIQQNKFVQKPIPENALILTTSEKPVNILGYETKCFKTEIDYGYACLSRR